MTRRAAIDGKILLVDPGRWSMADKKPRLRLGNFINSSFAAAHSECCCIQQHFFDIVVGQIGP